MCLLTSAHWCYQHRFAWYVSVSHYSNVSVYISAIQPTPLDVSIQAEAGFKDANAKLVLLYNGLTDDRAVRLITRRADGQPAPLPAVSWKPRQLPWRRASTRRPGPACSVSLGTGAHL